MANRKAYLQALLRAFNQISAQYHANAWDKLAAASVLHTKQSYEVMSSAEDSATKRAQQEVSRALLEKVA